MFWVDLKGTQKTSRRLFELILALQDNAGVTDATMTLCRRFVRKPDDGNRLYIQ